MSKKCLFERATGLYVGGSSYDDLPHDIETHIQLTLVDYPDRREERWNGAVGVRPATVQELTDFDAAGADAEATRDIDGMKGFRALAAEMLTEINTLRSAAGLPSISSVKWRQRLVDRHKAL